MLLYNYMSNIEKLDLLLEIKDILGNDIRTTKTYWKKITEIKHGERETSIDEVINTIKKPEEVRRSIQDSNILLFYRKWGDLYLVIVIKYIYDQGFIVTMYKISKVRRKGEIVWQQKNKM